MKPTDNSGNRSEKKTGKGGWKKLLFLLVLALPFIAFFITKHFSDVNLKMPGHYVVERVNAVSENGKLHYDTVYHRMEPFDLVNQLGHPITRKDLEGKVIVANFFHASGDSVSGRLSSVLEKIQNTFSRSDTGLRIISITTAPAHDSIPVLKHYADRYNANHDIWWFLHGSPKQVKKIAKVDFNISFKKTDSGNVLYSPMLILLDRRQYVRGYYNVLDSAQVRDCVHDISLLMIEKGKDLE